MDILRERLETMIRRSGKPVSVISTAAGCNVTALRQIMSGKSKNPRLDTVSRLATVLGCPIGYLTGEMQTPEYAPVDMRLLEGLIAKIVDVKKGYSPEQIARWVAHKYSLEINSRQSAISEEETIDNEIKTLDCQSG